MKAKKDGEKMRSLMPQISSILTFSPSLKTRSFIDLEGLRDRSKMEERREAIKKINVT